MNRIENNNILVSVTLLSAPTDVAYSCSYDNEICVGELIRNLCVNLGIDPDTRDGVTENITVYRDGLVWSYVPNRSIIQCLTQGENSLTLQFQLRE